MTPRDILKMCLQNLLRRKSRTLLTVLGVVIGCCSIVIMVSIGIGTKAAQEAMLAEMGDLTIITVSPQNQGRGKVKLNDSSIRTISQIANVIAVSPKLSPEHLTLRVYAGLGDRYICDWITIAAFDSENLEKLGFKLVEGEYPQKNTDILVGEAFAYNFKDSFRPEGSNTVDRYANMDFSLSDFSTQKENMPKPYLDPLKMPLTLVIEKEDGGKYSVPLEVSGRLKEDYNKGYETSEGFVMDIEYLEKIVKDAGISQSNIEKKSYSSALVKVNDISKVAAIENEIKQLGFITQSMESIRKPMEKEAKQKQLMLGGLGAISLIVAAIGITNTMIMSISERTKEIGIMKALGCFVKDIRVIFLTEAGIIGLFGGIVGSVVSVLISLIMNLASHTGGVAKISIIPVWLIIFSILFSVFIGLASGYYPANKAVKIPALEAIKSD
ncbi:MAG: ABC transporter permease [Angelakisella sp.]